MGETQPTQPSPNADQARKTLMTLLGIEVVELVQRGESDSVYDIAVRIDGTETTLTIGDTRALRGPGALCDALLERRVVATKPAGPVWDQALKALMDLVRVIPTETDDESLARLICQRAAREPIILSILSPDGKDAKHADDQLAFSGGGCGFVRDRDGRVAFQFEPLLNYMMVQGDRRNTRLLRAALSRIGLTYKRLSLSYGGARHQRWAWVSDTGFLEDDQ